MLAGEADFDAPWTLAERKVAPPPPVVAPVARSRSRAWLWAVPAVVLLAACVFLTVQNRAAAATVDALSTRVPELLLPVGEQNPLDQQLASVRKNAAAGKFQTAKEEADALALPGGTAPAMPEGNVNGPGPDSGPPPAPGADGQPPVEGDTQAAEAFFNAHTDLAERFSAYSEEALALRNAGKDVQPLRDLRTQILNAAGAGNAAQVSGLLDRFAQVERALGGNPPAAGNAPGGDLRQVVGDFQNAYEKAVRENRDPRAAVALMNGAMAAAHAGNRAQATALARQALAAIQRAPKTPGGGTGRGAAAGPGPSGPPADRAQRLLGVVMPMVMEEDKDLADTHAALQQAAQALQQDDETKTHAALVQAQAVLLRMSERRHAVNAELGAPAPTPAQPATAGHHAGAGAAAAGTTPAAGTQSAASTAVPPAAAEKLGELFDQIRGMTPAQYQGVKAQLVQQMVGLLLAGDPAGEAAGPAPTLTFPAGMPAEERTRAKLDIAQGACLDLKKQGKDVAPMLDQLAASRADLAAARVADAEAKVDTVLKAVGLLPPDHPAPGPLSLEGGSGRTAHPFSVPPHTEQPAPPPTAGKPETH
jgi:hypothetical protein